MSLLRKFKIVVFLFSLTALVSKAEAGLYGFHAYNPITHEEEILNLKKLPLSILNYRANMRDNLLMLIKYAKEKNPDFKIIAHEGQDLLTKSLWEYDREGYNRARQHKNAEDSSFLFHDNYQEQEPKRYTAAYDYLNALDAIVLNNIYCGKGYEGKVTKNHHLGLITIEHCTSEDDLTEAEVKSTLEKRISYIFSDIDMAFKTIGNYYQIEDSSKNIYDLKEAQNILFLIDDTLYENKEQFVADILKTNYDIVIIKPLFANKERFSTEDLQKLHFKKNGSKRLLIAEMNVSEASPDDYFWLKDWQIGLPQWLVRKSFSTPNAIIVQFWHSEWKRIISRYFKDILNEGFDGIFFTGIENYHYFEQQTPLE